MKTHQSYAHSYADRYKPYEHLNGAFSFEHRELFEPFTPGDYIALLNQLLEAPVQAQLEKQIRQQHEIAAAARRKAAARREHRENETLAESLKGYVKDLKSEFISYA